MAMSDKPASGIVACSDLGRWLAVALSVALLVGCQIAAPIRDAGPHSRLVQGRGAALPPCQRTSPATAGTRSAALVVPANALAEEGFRRPPALAAEFERPASGRAEPISRGLYAHSHFYPPGIFTCSTRATHGPRVAGNGRRRPFANGNRDGGAHCGRHWPPSDSLLRAPAEKTRRAPGPCRRRHIFRVWHYPRPSSWQR